MSSAAAAPAATDGEVSSSVSAAVITPVMVEVAPPPPSSAPAPTRVVEPRRAWFKHLLKFRLFSGEQPKISPLAVVDKEAEIADDVEIGPFSVIGPHVRIGKGCKLFNNVTIMGHTTIGENNVFFPNAVIGAPPQDLKYKGADTRLEIGQGNTFREAVTVHVGTEKGGGITRIGDLNLLMVNVHLGHDVQLQNRCIIANNCMIAGHVVIGSNVAMMGGVGLHHKVSVGDFCYIAGYAQIHHDAPPYVKIDSSDRVRQLNTTGLRRAGFGDEDIAALNEAVRALWFGKKKSMSQAMAEYDLRNGINPHVKLLIEFLKRRNAAKNGRYLDGPRPA